MPTTMQSSIGSAVATSTGDPVSDPDASATAFTTNTTLVLINAGDAFGSGAFGANVLADGAAFGTDTFTSVQIAASAVDGAYADAVSATVLVTGAAQSSNAEAMAFATAMAELIGGADVMIGITHTSSMTATEGDSQTTVAVAFASITALQFDTGGTSSNVAESPDCGCGGSDPSTLPDPAVLGSENSVFNGADLDGNLATFDIAAIAFGENTAVDVQVDAIAFEDQFSGVTATVFVLIA